MLNTLISPDCLFIHADLRHISPNDKHFPISVILPFIPQASIFKVKETIWITSQIINYLSYKSTIEANGQDYDDKTKKLTEDLTVMITPMMDQV